MKCKTRVLANSLPQSGYGLAGHLCKGLPGFYSLASNVKSFYFSLLEGSYQPFLPAQASPRLDNMLNILID